MQDPSSAQLPTDQDQQPAAPAVDPQAAGSPTEPPAPGAGDGAPPTAETVYLQVETDNGVENLTGSRIQELLDREAELISARTKIGQQSNEIGMFRQQMQSGVIVPPMAIPGLQQAHVPHNAYSAQPQYGQQPPVAQQQTEIPKPEPIVISPEDIENPEALSQKMNDALIRYGSVVYDTTVKAAQDNVSRTMAEQAQINQANQIAAQAVGSNTYLKTLNPQIAKHMFDESVAYAVNVNHQYGRAVITNERDAVITYLSQLGIQSAFDDMPQLNQGVQSVAAQQQQPGTPIPVPVPYQAPAAGTPTQSAKALQRAVKNITLTSTPIVQPQGGGTGVPPEILAWQNADKAGKHKIVSQWEKEGTFDKNRELIRQHLPQKKRAGIRPEQEVM